MKYTVQQLVTERIGRSSCPVDASTMELAPMLASGIVSKAAAKTLRSFFISRSLRLGLISGSIATARRASQAA
jgi:hypothetical protein